MQRLVTLPKKLYKQLQYNESNPNQYVCDKSSLKIRICSQNPLCICIFTFPNA